MRATFLKAIALVITALLGSGCALGPKALECSHVKYNTALKQVAEEQMLLNIVRLRYDDSPERLDVSAIAAQYEVDGTLEARPFFATESTSSTIESFTRILPFGAVSGATRPTLSFTPLDDPETLRGLFTPANLDAIILLAETSYPIETVFRLWLEYLNRLPNAVTASGPARDVVPEFRDFQRVARLLQILQNRGDIRFLREEKLTRLGSPMPPGSVTPAHQVEAARNGLEYVEEPNQSWVLIRRDRQLKMKVNPPATASPEMLELCALLHLKQGLLSYDVAVAHSERPFPLSPPTVEATTLDLFPRSVVQVSYFLAQGVEVPPEHVIANLVRIPREAEGRMFDWSQVTEGLFTVHQVKQHERPKEAYVAVKYRDHWFYIDDRDHDSKVTFSLVLMMTRVNLLGIRKGGPMLTLPVGR